MADPTITPALSYQNPRAALDFLRDAFGFELDMLIEDEAGKRVHSQMLHGDGRIMVGTEWTDDNKSPQSIGGTCTQTVHIHLKEDIDAHCQSARAAGADILAEPQTQSYGDRTCRARSRGSYLDVLTDYRGADAGRMGQECRRA